VDKYIETLKKLCIKGIITEEELKQKIEEYNFKKAILETMDNGYVKKTFNRIYNEKKQ
jgi:hypothetical protein